MPHPVTWFEITSDKPAELSSWYADVFGWSVDPIDGMDYAVVGTGGAVGGGITGTQPGMAPDVTMYVEVADLEGTLDRISGAGGTVVVPVTEIPDMVTFAQFADPCGNVLGLVLAPEASTPAVLLYTPAADVLVNAAPHMAAHGARLDEFRTRGELLQVGVFGDPQHQGSMAIFRSRAAAEAFVAEDPFRLHGVIESYEIRDWHV